MLGIAPKTWNEKYDLWLTLTDRGVTALTDSMFEELYRDAQTDNLKNLEKEANKRAHMGTWASERYNREAYLSI